MPSSLDGKFSTYRILRDTRRSKQDNSARPDVDAVDQGASTSQEIDLHALARRIYALLRHELQLERERLGRNGRC